MNNQVKTLVLNALVASIYFVLVFVFNFLSFEAVQFRIAEAILVFVFFNRKLIPGLIFGTFIANLVFSPFGLIDALVGTLASLVAVTLMAIFKKKAFISLVFPALSNAFIVGYMITYMSNTPFLINFSLVFLGEFIVMYTVGLALYLIIDKREDIKELLIDNNSEK